MLTCQTTTPWHTYHQTPDCYKVTIHGESRLFIKKTVFFLTSECAGIQNKSPTSCSCGFEVWRSGWGGRWWDSPRERKERNTRVKRGQRREITYVLQALLRRAARMNCLEKDRGSHRRFVSVAIIRSASIVRYLHQHPAVSCVCCAFMINACGLIYLCIKWLRFTSQSSLI